MAKKKTCSCGKIINYNEVCYSNRLQVQHIKPREFYPELMYEDSNLITLCDTCNRQLGIQETLDFDWQEPEIELNL